MKRISVKPPENQNIKLPEMAPKTPAALIRAGEIQHTAFSSPQCVSNQLYSFSMFGYFVFFIRGLQLHILCTLVKIRDPGIRG